MPYRTKEIYYCKECNKLYKSCYEFDNVFVCYKCWSENITVIPESKISTFIRKKRLERLNDISKLFSE